MADLTHNSAAMLRPPGPFIPLPVADQMTKAVALLYDVEIPELTPTIDELADQLNAITAGIADSGLMLWVSPIVYFRTECGFGEYLQDVSAHRVSDWDSFLYETLSIEATAPWRRPIYHGDTITDYDGRPGYAWRFFNHFGIDIYDASGGRGVYGLFDGFFPGKDDINVNDTVDLYPSIIRTTSFSVVWDHLAIGLPKIGFYLYSNGARIRGAEALVDVSAGSHTFSGLTAGTTYVVEGYLMNRYNQSSTASTVSVTTQGGLTPAAPTNITTKIDQGNLTISWNPVSSATLYNLYSNSILDEYGITGTSITKNNLAPGTYNIQISAVNAFGEGPLSVAIPIVIPELNIPTGLMIDQLGTTSATLAWDYNEVASYYNIYINTIPHDSANNTQGESPSYILADLAPGVEYSVTVTTVTDNGIESPQSQPIVFTTLVDKPLPDFPTGVAATNPHSSGFTVSWDPVTTATYYKVYVDSSTSGTIFFESTATTIDISNGILTPASFNETRMFNVCVSAINNAGEGDKSDPVWIETTYVPPKPTGLVASNITTTGFTLSWDPVTNPNITNFAVTLDGNMLGTPLLSDVFTATYNNIIPGTYSVAVNASNMNAGTGATSDPITVSIGSVLAAPTGVTVTNPYSSGFTVSWDSVASATSYMIFIYSSVTGDLAIGPIPTALTSFIVSDIDLEPPPNETRSYNVSVRAYIGSTQGPTSDSVPVTVNTLPPLTYFASEEDTPLQNTNELIIVDSADYDSSQLSANYALIDITGLTSISTVRTNSTSFPYVSREMIAICIIPPTSSFYAPGGDNSFLLTNTVSGGGTNNPTVPFSAVITSSKRTIAYAKFTLDMFILGFYSSVEYKTISAPSSETLATLSLTYSYSL